MKWVKNRVGNFLHDTYDNYKKDSIEPEDIEHGYSISNTAYLCSIGLIAWEGYNFVYTTDPISSGSILVILLALWTGSFTRQIALDRSLKNNIDLEDALED